MCNMTAWKNKNKDFVGIKDSVPTAPLKNDHFTLNSSALEVTDRLLQEILGFSEIDRPARWFPGRWYSLSDIEIHVIAKNYTEGKKVKELISEELLHYLPVDHIAFKVEWCDFHYWYHKLNDNDIKISVDDHRPDLKLRQIFFKDVGGSEAQFELNFR